MWHEFWNFAFWSKEGLPCLPVDTLTCYKTYFWHSQCSWRHFVVNDLINPSGKAVWNEDISWAFMNLFPRLLCEMLFIICEFFQFFLNKCETWKYQILLFLWRSVKGKDFSLDAWNQWNSSRHKPTAPVCWDEFKKFLYFLPGMYFSAEAHHVLRLCNVICLHYYWFERDKFGGKVIERYPIGQGFTKRMGCRKSLRS